MKPSRRGCQLRDNELALFFAYIITKLEDWKLDALSKMSRYNQVELQELVRNHPCDIKDQEWLVEAMNRIPELKGFHGNYFERMKAIEEYFGWEVTERVIR